MDTQKKVKENYIILIPHRDALRPLFEYRRRLFSAGIYGAHSFPMAAPLAKVSRPFSHEELKESAISIRKLTIATGGKIFSKESALVPCPTGSGRHLSFFGPLLNLPAEEGIFPLSAKDKILHSLLPTVLCAALVEQCSIISSHEGAKTQRNMYSLQANRNPPCLCELRESNNLNFEKAPALSFRAAALANMAIRPLDCGERLSEIRELNYSFEWKIGPAVWLPAYKKQA